MRRWLVRWQLWLGLALGGYLLVRSVLNQQWGWALWWLLLLALHVYKEATRPQPDAGKQTDAV